MSYTTPHVVGFAGSLRDESTSRLALQHALATAEEYGGQIEHLDLRDFDLPRFDPDASVPDDGRALQQSIRSADAVIIATPMYHGSYASPTKNALDYCGPEDFEQTTVGLLGVSGGGFPLTALHHLRIVCQALNARVIPHQVAIPNVGTAFENGEFVRDDLADRVETLGRETVIFASARSEPEYAGPALLGTSGE
jgi:NAD(P)H-dependent FMN reductase